MAAMKMVTDESGDVIGLVEVEPVRTDGGLLAYVSGIFEGDDFLVIGFTPEYRMWKKAGTIESDPSD
jgi:hypothetical protein